MTNDPSTKDTRTESAEIILREAFWDDYSLSARDILSRLDSGETGFDRFLFSKIIENSRHPSRHLRNLFDPEHLRALLDRYLEQSGSRKRIRLVAANITKNYDLAREHGWNR